MGCCSSVQHTLSSKVLHQPVGKGSSKLQKDVKLGGIGHAQFILDNAGKISDFYDMERRKLGVGSFGSVYKAASKTTSAVRAIKTIAKSQMKSIERFKHEVAIMKFMDHPNIVKLYETFEDHRNIYLVMELCNGGELFDHIVEAGHLTEPQAAMLMQQIIRAVSYMHGNRVCHRDLKPENFVFMSQDPIERNTLKIIDFGLSCKFEPGQALRTRAGTPYYVAPQVIAGKYDHLSDMWSCGVIMYIMLCGYPPFFGDTDFEVLRRVRLGNFTFNAADWKTITGDARTLIRCLLKMNPLDRYTADQTLKHDWIQNKAPKAPNVSLQHGFVDNLRTFCSQNKLKRAALHVIAGQLNEGQIKALRDTFVSLDQNGDGFLTSLEMKEGLGKAGLKEIPADFHQILKDVDSDGSGVIDYTEFLAATMERRLYTQEDVCWSAFRLFDRNGDGKISKGELAQILNNGMVEQAIDGNISTETLIAQVDKDGDGQIDFEEFMRMMRAK